MQKQLSQMQLKSLVEHGTLLFRSSVDIKINLWYSIPNKQWRWVLTPEENSFTQESGNQSNLPEALLDIQRTLDYNSLKF